MATAYPLDDLPLEEVELSPLAKLQTLAGQQGNFAGALTAQALIELGSKCVDEYERDDKNREDWKKIAERALEAASQESKCEPKTYPWAGASNINVPLLTTACLQFNARMYPAVVKGDEAVLCKVVGQDNGRPRMMPNPQHGQMQAVPQMTQDPQSGQQVPVVDEQGKMVPEWEVPPGAKAKRARRVSEFLNTCIFYKMENWEDDTDALLMQMPAAGCVFRKIWFDPKKGCQSAMIPALRVVVPEGARNLETTPRITEEIPDVYPYQIRHKQRSSFYLNVDLGLDAETEDDGARLLLEQHRLIDLDEDGIEEPYIVTIDHQTRQVLRIETSYGPDDIEVDEGEAIGIVPGRFYVKYGMFPHPKGSFYDIGLGHLLDKMGAVIDTALNQLMDAGTAQTAGGGFIGAGVRLQGRGQRGVIRLAPGEYKTVDVSGDTLRANIVERTLPNVSPVTFQVLDFIMGFAKEIAGAKDVLTGEASNTAPVGSTLALIEQGLQVFNATAKRYFRNAKKEYTLYYDNYRKYGGERAAKYYQDVLDDPEADFFADFSAEDLDIRPVSDPSTVTRMQKLAKAQVIQQSIPILSAVGGDTREALRRAYEAADIEDIDKLLPPPKPTPPDPMAEAQARLVVAKAMQAEGSGNKAMAEAAVTVIEGQIKQLELRKTAMGEGAKLAVVDHGSPA